MFHRRDNKIFIWAAFGLLLMALAAGAVMSIQPAGAQAPIALPHSAQPAAAKAGKTTSGNPVSRANPPANVAVLQGHLSQAQDHPGTAPARAEVASVPEYSIDLAKMGVHPISRNQVPARFFKPEGATIGTQNAILSTSPDVVSQTTASAFSTLFANFTPAETVNLSLNGGTPTGFAANADGRAFVRVTTGAGQGFITVEAIGQTSGKRAGSVVQVLDNAPYVPGVAAGPHAVNNSVSGSTFSLYGARWRPSGPITVSRNGVSLGSFNASVNGTLVINITEAVTTTDTSAVYSYVTTTVGSLAGQSVEERGDAGTPPQGDTNTARVFIDRPVFPSVGGATISLVGDGFQAGENVNVTGCATGTVPADANGSVGIFLTFSGGTGTAQCVFTGATSGRVGRGSIQGDPNAINAPSGINSPGTAQQGAADFTILFDRLLPNQSGTIFLDGVSQGTASTNAGGYGAATVSLPPTMTIGIHEAAFSGASGQIAIAPLYVIPSVGGTPTSTPTITPTPACTPAWSLQANYPRNILDQAVAAQGTSLYSFSGISNGLFITDSYKYDTGTSTWSTIAPLPAALERPSAASNGTFVYILGGVDGTSFNVTNGLYRYDPSGNSYTTLASNPITGTWAQGAAVVGNKLYWIGGCGTDGNCTTNATANVEAYDISAGTWSAVAPMPQALGFPQVTTLGGFIYVAGGTGASGDSLKTYRYDPVGNSWNDAAIADLPTTRFGAASGVLGSSWLLAGGFESGALSNTTMSWDSVGNSWTSIATMPLARARQEGGGAGGAVYSFGGTNAAGGFTGTADNQRYLPVACALTSTSTPTVTGTPTISSTPTISATPTNSATSTNTRTATPSPTCPPLFTTIGRGNPGKVETALFPANGKSSVSAGSNGSKSIPAGRIPGPTQNAPVAFQLDDGTRENSIGFGSTVSNTQSAAVWLNRFTPPAGAYPITISQIHILWPVQTTITDTIIGKQVRLLIYKAAPGGTITSTTLLYQQFVTVGVTETFQTYNLSSPPTIAGPDADLYIGFEDFWAESANFQPRMFPAAIDTTPPSQVRSWVAGKSATPGAPDIVTLGNNDALGTIDSFGLPGNWMIRASGITSLADPCPATFTPTPVPPTATATPAVTPQLVVHLTWQGIAQPNSRNTTETLTTTLRLTTGGPDVEFGPNSTDANGTYTLPVGSLPNGTYTIRAKGPRNLSNGAASCDTVTLSGGTITNKELGTMRAGDASSVGLTNFNVVNATDFTTLKATFGKSFGQPGYDARADFNNTDNVDATDFTLLKNNFGSAGCPNP